MEKIKRKSLSEQVLDSIIQYVETNHLEVGDKIPTEGEFSEMLGVSRTSIREAIKALSMNGALQSIPGKGTFIRRDIAEVRSGKAENTRAVIQARASIKEIMEVRTTLESLAFDLVVEKCTEADIAYVQEAMDSLRADVQSGRPWAMSGTMFHTRIAELAGNELLEGMIRSLSIAIARYKDELYKAETLMKPYIDEHQHILDALKNKDKKAGHKAIKAHNVITENDLYSLIDKNSAVTFLDLSKTV